METIIEENWLLLSIVCGFVAKRIGRSFWKYFFLSLLLSPVIGFIVLLIKGKKTDEQVVVNTYEVREDNPQPLPPIYTAIVQENKKYCSACGAQLEMGSQYCSYCGKKIE